MIDTILEGGAILDGTGGARFTTDLAIVGERIVRIGNCEDLEARERFDCSGRIVAPGFIDPRSQSARDWLETPAAPAKIAQGVTTAICALENDEEFLNDLGHTRTGTNLALVARDRVATFDDIGTLAPEAEVHLANLRAEWPAGRGAMHRMLERIDSANAAGARVTCDVVPYVATWIALPSLLPAGVTPKELGDAAVAAAVALEMQARLGERWHDVVLAEIGDEPCAERLTAARAVEVIASVGERARAFVFCLNEDDIATAFSAAFTMPASHARVTGAFPRIFGRYVRQRRVFAIEEAVSRMTSLPARTFGLRDRGTIASDKPADLVVFDEMTCSDTATYDRPDALPVGLTHVFVNGFLALRAGALTGARGGRVLHGGRS